MCINSICLAELDGTNKLKFYFIDLFDAAIWTLQDNTLEVKLFHTFEIQQNQEGFRVFEKANSGLVFESFYLLDVEAAPGIVIVASDASHQGKI